MARQLSQHDVPHGMVAKCPWGQPLERWADDMLLRGYENVALERDVFPNLTRSLFTEINERGLVIA